MPSIPLSDIASERKNLMNLMDKGEFAIPKRQVDENILIATWNIQKFGNKKELRAIQYIADIIERFDIIAIQELQTDLTGLEKLIELLPGNYKFLVSEPIGNNERFGFIYDKRTVINTGLVSNVVFSNPDDKKERYLLSRIPYCASFKAGRFDFIIVTVHIYFGEGTTDKKRLEEINKIVDYIDIISKRAGTKTFDRDIFIMGDFNIPEDGDLFFRALIHKGFQMPLNMNKLLTNYEQSHTFDKIAWVDRPSFQFSDNCNVVPYGNVLYQEIPISDRKKKISDHLPLWAEFSVNKLTQELDSIIKAKKE
jgi:endonuclease/exonuclease/phosphatase family metal-dependent hydrolase